MQIKYPSKTQATLPPLIFLSFFLAIFSFVWFLKTYSAIAVFFFVVGLSGISLFFKLLLNFETGWIFDEKTAEIYFYKKYAQKQKNKFVSTFADIAAIYVQGRHNRAYIHTWWNYRIMMLFHSGNTEQISDFFEKGPDEANKLGREIANLIGCQFFPAHEEKVTKIRLFNQYLDATYHSWGWADVFREFWLATFGSLLLLAAIGAFIVGLVIILSQ